jgi:hypothetical protein
MKLFFSIFLSFFIVHSVVKGQINNSGSNNKNPSPWVLDTNDVKIKTILEGASSYLISIIGKNTFQQCIVFDEITSIKQKRCFERGNDSSAVLETGCIPYYNLNYFFIDKQDTIGYIDINVDSNGHLFPIFSPGMNTEPELILGYKKIVNNEFNISRAAAFKIGQGKGFTTYPTLSCETVNQFNNKNKRTFVLVEYYWDFFEATPKWATMSMELNAQNGEIRNETYNPKMPK